MAAAIAAVALRPAPPALPADVFSADAALAYIEHNLRAQGIRACPLLAAGAPVRYAFAHLLAEGDELPAEVAALIESELGARADDFEHIRIERRRLLLVSADPPTAAFVLGPADYAAAVELSQLWDPVERTARWSVTDSGVLTRCP